jgi:hypothetical protein
MKAEGIRGKFAMNPFGILHEGVADSIKNEANTAQ